MRVQVFDVNETLLDLSALDTPFREVFGDPSARRTWFGQVIQLALTATITGAYRDFATVAGAALDMTAEATGVSLSGDRRAQMVGMLRTLPPHPEAPEALRRLRDAGFRLATLTNSPPATVAAQMESSGLGDLFERSLSVDAVQLFKPHRRVYHYAAEELGVAPGDLRLVAAHNWDVTGANRAGCMAAFVARPGMVLGPLDEHPDVVGRDLNEVVDRILEVDA